jgi:hypothetical protein
MSSGDHAGLPLYFIPFYILLCTYMTFQLRMAALNEPCTGDMTGVRGADYSCYRESRRAGLRGTFRAFLSSRVQNLDSIVRFSDRDLPVVNTKVILKWRCCGQCCSAVLYPLADKVRWIWPD